MTSRGFVHSVSLSILRLAAFGAAASLGRPLGSVLRGAVSAPLLFAGGAALAAPTLYLASALGGIAASPSATALRAESALSTVGTLAWGLVVPAAFFSVTLHGATAVALAAVVSALLGVVGVLRFGWDALDFRAQDKAQLLALAWLVTAFGLGARMLWVVGRGLVGGAS